MHKPILFLWLFLVLASCSVHPGRQNQLASDAPIAHALRVGDTEEQVLGKLGEPAYIPGAKQFPNGVVRVWAYRSPVEEWLYFWNGIAVEWGVPGDWDTHADRINDVNQSSAADSPPARSGTTESLGSAFKLTDAQKAAAEQAVHGWLSLVDAGDYQESWRTASDVFRTRTEFSLEDWKSMVQYLRQSLGDIQKRTLTTIGPMMVFPGGPKGDYLAFQFDCVLVKKPSVIEGVSVRLEPDGVWRVASHDTM
ncbi:MAG: DUF4019 domain-containing protein [Thermoanaerobaculia bacterium]